jgi:hypothetical protein
LAMLGLVLGSKAHAQPRVHFDVAGSCPSQAELVRAFGAQVLVAAPAEREAWRVQVQEGAGEAAGATVVLRTPAGELASTRTIRSDDCAALAQAFAFIVLAHFVELRLIEAQPAPSMTTEPARAADTRPAASATAPADPAPVTALTLDVALGAGIGLGIAPAGAAPAAELALGLGASPSGWRAQLAAQLSAPVQQSSGSDRVEHWASGMRLELGGRIRLGRPWWLAGGVGGGIAFVRVTALDLAQEPATLRLWPAATMTVALGLQLLPAWSLRWATAAQLHFRSDRYRIEPEGVVAESPRAAIASTLGLQFDAPL